MLMAVNVDRSLRNAVYAISGQVLRNLAERRLVLTGLQEFQPTARANPVNLSTPFVRWSKKPVVSRNSCVDGRVSTRRQRLRRAPLDGKAGGLWQFARSATRGRNCLRPVERKHPVLAPDVARTYRRLQDPPEVVGLNSARHSHLDHPRLHRTSLLGQGNKDATADFFIGRLYHVCPLTQLRQHANISVTAHRSTVTEVVRV